MQSNVARDLAALARMTVAQLRERYAELFGEPTRTGNRTWLVRRVGWRIQALAEGDLSARARTRAAELARDADLRVVPPRDRAPEPAPRLAVGEPATAADPRLPPPGTVITRRYKGADVQVRVLAAGFEYDGRTFASLSAVAKAVTGSHCNGFHFFKLNKDGAA